MSTPAADDFGTISVLYDELRRASLCAVASLGRERPRDLSALQADCVACGDPKVECYCCEKRRGKSNLPANCRLCFWETGLPCPR